jgi:PAS fold
MDARCALRERVAAWLRVDSNGPQAEIADRVGFWDCNKRDGLTWSPYMFKLFNVEQKAGTIDVDADFFAAVHPDDREGLKLLLVNATRNGGRFTTQYKVQWQDGTVQVIQASAGKVLNEDGSVSLFGTCVSLTELQLLYEIDCKSMQREHALCQQLVASRQRTPARRVSIAAMSEQEDFRAWRLGTCFAQVLPVNLRYVKQQYATDATLTVRMRNAI